MRVVKPLIAAAMMALLLFVAPAALAASAPTAITGPNTPEPGDKVRLLGYVGPEGSPVIACKFEYGPEAGSYDGEAPCANHPGNEIQILSIFAGTGNFKLGFGAETTTDLAFDASAAEVQAALRALPAVGSEGVSVSPAGPANGFTFLRITFEGPLGDTDVSPLKVVAGSEPLAAHTSFVDTLVPGGLADPVEVTARLEGLTAGATYHYRLVAENGSGTMSSPDATFTLASEPATESCANAGSPGAGFLPDCRAWEMVSPPDKNGGNVLLYSNRIRLATDGSATMFASKTPFGEGIAAGVASEHLSLRSSSGWSTHGVMPPQPPATIPLLISGLDPNYENDVSPDDEKGVLLAWKALNEEDPNVDEVANLYLREDLRSGGGGTYRLVTRCPLCGEKEVALPGSLIQERPYLIGATPDFTHILFESTLNLAKGPGGQEPKGTGYKLYEWAEGAVTLVGILPNGKAAAESAAGSGPEPEYHKINHAVISADGTKVFFTEAVKSRGGGNLYMRLDGEETVQLNVPEPGAPVEPAQPARYSDASSDGSRVFFTSNQSLTSDSPPGPGEMKLYVYDTDLPPSSPNNLTYIDTVGSVIGASEDGSTVYFWRGTQNVPGAPPVAASTRAVFVWRSGNVRYLASPLDRDEARSGYEAFNAVKWTRISPDGVLLFRASNRIGLTGQNQRNPAVPACNATGGEPGASGCTQLYVYAPATDSLQCVSCARSGSVPVGRTLIEFTAEEAGTTLEGTPASSHLGRGISDDGRYAFFSSFSPLVPDDTNGTFDAYEFDLRTSEVHLLSSGTDPEPSFFADASANGSDSLVITHQKLSAWDTDAAYDLYDARVDGGVPEPRPRPAPCEGESCRPPVSPAPPPEPASSASFAGPGNGKHPRRPRKRHRHHHRAHHRHQGARHQPGGRK